MMRIYPPQENPYDGQFAYRNKVGVLIRLKAHNVWLSLVGGLIATGWGVVLLFNAKIFIDSLGYWTLLLGWITQLVYAIITFSSGVLWSCAWDHILAARMLSKRYGDDKAGNAGVHEGHLTALVSGPSGGLRWFIIEWQDWIRGRAYAPWLNPRIWILVALSILTAAAATVGVGSDGTYYVSSAQILSLSPRFVRQAVFDMQYGYNFGCGQVMLNGQLASVNCTGPDVVRSCNYLALGPKVINNVGLYDFPGEGGAFLSPFNFADPYQKSYFTGKYGSKLRIGVEKSLFLRAQARCMHRGSSRFSLGYSEHYNISEVAYVVAVNNNSLSLLFEPPGVIPSDNSDIVNCWLEIGIDTANDEMLIEPTGRPTEVPRINMEGNTDLVAVVVLRLVDYLGMMVSQQQNGNASLICSPYHTPEAFTDTGIEQWLSGLALLQLMEVTRTVQDSEAAPRTLLHAKLRVQSASPYFGDLAGIHILVVSAAIALASFLLMLFNCLASREKYMCMEAIRQPLGMVTAGWPCLQAHLKDREWQLLAEHTPNKILWQYGINVHGHLGLGYSGQVRPVRKGDIIG
ncbi:uncharacterized protein VTP21DRAFT_6984 [Calcarisporiella thermophila]|uniref:uncharacterized protein n=1 Tax=Calcarisporiella thermophila TaxID=911321 RepID=UPI0037437101